jgi:hypothetical protein
MKKPSNKLAKNKTMKKKSNRKSNTKANWLKRVSSKLPKRSPRLIFALLFAAVGTVMLFVALANPTYTDTVLSNPALPDGVAPLGKGRVAENNGKTYLLYAAKYSNAPWLRVRDETTGAVSHVAIPAGTTGGTAWALADIAVAGNDVWIVSGGGPVYLRHYRLSGSSLPTSSTMVSEKTFGNSDSRAGAITSLKSGNVAGVWHQQGALGIHGLGIFRSTPADSVNTIYPVEMASRSSTQAMVQHPADDSIWVFSSADAGAAIHAVHVTEILSGLQVDWKDGSYITDVKYGNYGPDPEAPDIEAAADPATGTIALAYQSAERKIFSTQPFVAGSHLAVARVKTDASVSFINLPVYVERISAIGLTVRNGETWLAYRPINGDLTFDTLHISRHNGSSWGGPIAMGKLGDPRAMVYFGKNFPIFGAPMIDNLTHLFDFSLASTPTPPASGDTSAPTVTIANPADEAVVSGSVYVSATAADNLGVTRMELLVDGKVVASGNSGSLTYSWNTRKVTKGSHSIEVKAYDAAGNSGSRSITVTVGDSGSGPRKNR